jgi:hypothetical protein
MRISLPFVPLLASIGLFGQAVTPPYSAVQIMEITQTLANGTKVKLPQQKMLMFRDSQGRTRSEMTVSLPMAINRPNVPMPVMPTIISISDPVAGFSYVLDSGTKVARRISVAGMKSNSPSGLAPIAAAAALAKKEPLGTQLIDGFLCDGERATTTYPAGTVGNDQDLISITESWTSQELKVPMMMKMSDPRIGETLTRLTELNRATPDTTLFVVPPEYTIQDQAMQTRPKL